VAKPLRAEELRAALEAALPGAAPEARENGAGEAFDRAQLMERVLGDVELLRELIALFLDSYPGQLAQIGAAIEAGDAGALERAAHSLKGSVSHFAAREPFEAALRLEQMGLRGDLAGAEEAYQLLEASIQQLQAGLEALALE
jgi:HPt (histidine-containing phosphotransfer) domain-containing protein